VTPVSRAHHVISMGASVSAVGPSLEGLETDGLKGEELHKGGPSESSRCIVARVQCAVFACGDQPRAREREPCVEERRRTARRRSVPLVSPQPGQLLLQCFGSSPPS
jgi:hypothetical protein